MVTSYFDPSTLLIEEPFDNAAFNQAASLGTSGISGLGGTLRRAERLWVPESVEQSALQVLRAREHEWTHYRQHVSTTFGYFFHRLLTVREHGYWLFLEEQRNSKGVLTRPDVMPLVHAAASHSSGNRLSGGISAWMTANLILGCLWQKKVRNHELEKTVSHVAPVLHLLGNFTPGLPSPDELSVVTRGPRDGWTCADGRLTAESVMEGLARYREFHELTVHLPVPLVDALLKPVGRGTPLGEAAAYAEDRLSMPYSHWMVGALLEAAVSSFPIEVVDGSRWTWEEIHPGSRFEAAVARLVASDWRAKAELNDYAVTELPHLFDVALEACGERPDDYRARYAIAGEALRETANETGARQLDAFRSNEGEFNLNTLYTATVMRCFAEAFLLRADAPWIFWNPQLALHLDAHLWNRFVHVTAPPLVLGPTRFSMPLAHTDDHYNEPVCQMAHLIGTGQALVLNDLQRSGRLSHSARFIRALRNPEQFNGQGEDWILDATRAAIGDDLLQQLLKESRLA